ncbi:MAG: hypothetical protein HW421_1855 [Ignavibacteria bacterium]|nr:hypothetical protein [Ignavibacteria bacterium]
MKKLFLILYITFLILSANETYALPVFARKYKTSCATCHVAVTKRNAFGEAFRRNGYFMPERDAQLIKEPPLRLGAEAWKELWPDAIWPSTLPGNFPVAACVRMKLEYITEKPQTGSQFGFSLPSGYSIFYAGGFGENIGFLGALTQNGLGRFYFRINDIIGGQHNVNLKFGLMEPGITDGFTVNQHIILEDNGIWNYSAHGGFSAYNTRPAIELTGILGHYLQYCAGIANGEAGFLKKPFDNKHGYGRIAYKLFGYGMDGSGILEDTTNMDYWTDNSLTLGFFGYFGNTTKTDTSNKNYNNEFNRFGFDARLKLGNADILGGAIFGKDKNPDNTPNSLSSLCYFVGCDYIFYPWLLAAVRFENGLSGFDKKDDENYYKFIPNITILYRQNIRISLEGLFEIKGDLTDGERTIQGDTKQAFKRFWFNWFVAF